MSKKKQASLSAFLRAAVRDSGQSLYLISKESGVPYATLHRFMAGKRAVSMEALERLCDYLGLELRPKDI
jgi:lambda repressor-like predicted transcriptional regulator